MTLEQNDCFTVHHPYDKETKMKVIKDSEFETEVKQSDVPVLVDFFAQWCGPCRQLGPVLEEIANEMGGKLKIVKMDIDEAPTAFGIRSIPTMILFKNGQAVETKVGGMPKSKVVEWLNSVV